MSPIPFAGHRQRGAASLAVVMVLFFILAMVAAYTNRNLIFEQRTSANSYRSARALAAADAGADWAIAMLNGGVIGTACNGTTPTDDFRTRYLQLAQDGSFTPVTWATIWAGGPTRIQAQPSCSANAGGTWDCNCPIAAPPALLNSANDQQPVFTVGFVPNGRPGVVALRIRGCHTVRAGTVDSSNVNSFGSCHVNDLNSTDPNAKAFVQVDSSAVVRVSLGLVSALPVVPTAALTVGGTIAQSMSTELRAVNADPNTGVALRAGGAIGDPSSVRTAGPAGSAREASVENDSDLAGMQATDFFRLALGLPSAKYRQQPAAISLNCLTGCNSSAELTTLVPANPTRVVFVDGDMALNSSTAIGTADLPTMLVVTGNVTVTQPIAFNGVIFAGGNLTWSAAGGTVNGAVIVGGNYSGSASATFIYDRKIVQRIHKGYGSFVRIPGSWNTES